MDEHPNVVDVIPGKIATWCPKLMQDTFENWHLAAVASAMIAADAMWLPKFMKCSKGWINQCQDVTITLHDPTGHKLQGAENDELPVTDVPWSAIQPADPDSIW